MSSQLTRLAGFNNAAQTCVVLAASSKLSAKPMVPMKHVDDHHHDEHMSLPNQPKPTTVGSMGKLLINGNLKVANSFTSQ